MNDETLTQLKDWFDSYVATFGTGDVAYDQNITLKDKHTKRVCEEALHIARNLGMAPNELRLAETMALLHDIGRFEQYARYGTFSDPASVNHAELGVAILRELNVLTRLDEAEADLVLRAIAYHNRRTLPEDETEECLHFSRLLRDADKLDIFRVFDDHYSGDGKLGGVALLWLPDTPGASPEILAELINGRSSKYEDMKNQVDFRLLQLGWAYDINFAPSIERIRTKRYLEKIRQALPPSDEIDTVFARIMAHLESKTIETGAGSV